MKRMISFFTRLCEAYLPDAFVFCLVLTLVVFALATAMTPHSPFVLIEFWGKDFWGLHTFAMQMVFVLISGHMLATAPIIKKCLTKLTECVHAERNAIIIISLFSIITCWINWGFGLIVSALMAIEFAKRLKKVNFGLFIATAYSGFLVWHGGLSGSIPLKIAGDDEVLTKIYPDLKIPLSETIFSTWNLMLVLTLMIVLPILLLSFRTEEKTEFHSEVEDGDPAPQGKGTIRSRLEHSYFFNIIFFFFFIVTMFRNDSSFDINRVNFIFLFSAILLHGNPYNFLRALKKSIGHSSGIIIQFPFYAGVMGLMQHSGLADLISLFFVKISTAETLPLWTFLSGGIVNFFVPSGGGQWVVQGPIMLKAARYLGVEPGKISMSLAWGDAWTNMIQPFWALPLLGMAGLQLKDIMGYCLIILFVSGLIITGALFML